jgi:hypothetical protein
VGRLTESPLFEISVQLPRREPARYVARLEIHQPDALPRVFEWPVEVPDPTLPLAAILSLTVATAAPGDTLELTVRDTGPTPLSFGRDYELQRWREDGMGWKYIWPEGLVLMILHELEPGASLALRVDVPRGARPGRHRIVKELGSQWAHGTVRAPVEFDVGARASQVVSRAACGRGCRGDG